MAAKLNQEEQQEQLDQVHEQELEKPETDDPEETSFLDELNQLAEKTSPYIRFDDLIAGTPYKIQKFSVFEGTKYKGNRLCAHIEDGYLILPERFDVLLENNLYEQLNNENNISIVFNGRDESKGNRLNINFIKEK